MMGDWEPAEWKLDDEGNGKWKGCSICWIVIKFLFCCVTAVFIDQDEGNCEYVKDSSMGDWAELPDLVLEKILSHLPLSERYHCSLVCKRYAV